MLKKFEEVSDKLNKNIQSDNEVENVIEWVKGNDKATVCFSQKRMISKIKKLAEKFPDEIEIVAENENQTSIIAHIPVKAIKINLSNKRIMSDEEKEAARDRLMRARGISNK